MVRLIARLPTNVLAMFALVMALAPFTPEPHLVEKFRMLLDGTLSRPIDLFDVAFHLFPAALLGLNLLAKKRLG